MATITWDGIGSRFYETGVDRGVLYVPDVSGVYNTGFAWNGLTSISENPSGAEANAQYADNIKYLNLFSAEEFGATIEAFTYPEEFNQFDGVKALEPGVYAGQQDRGTFGLSYRTKVGNDLEGNAHAYKLHLVYGCTASPSEKGFTTINDSPEPITFSWEVTTVPMAVTGGTPTSIMTIDTRTATAGQVTALEDLLYGTDLVEPALPTPDEVVTLFAA